MKQLYAGGARFRFGLRTLFKAITVIALLVIAAISLRRYQQSGITLFRASWPPELRALIDDLPVEAQQDFSGLRLYNNSFISTECFWQFDASQKAFDALVDKFELNKFDHAVAPSRECPRYWWTPDRVMTAQSATRYFGSASPELEGFQLVVTYDEQRRLLYGWLYFDF